MEYVNGIFETFLNKNEEEILKEIKNMSEMDKDKMILKSIGEVKLLRAVNDKYIDDVESAEPVYKTHPDDVTAVNFTYDTGKLNPGLTKKVYKIVVDDNLVDKKNLGRNTLIGFMEHETDGTKNNNAGAFKFSGYDIDKLPNAEPSKLRNERRNTWDFWLPRGAVQLFIPAFEEISAAE